MQGTEKMMATGTDEERGQQCPSQETRLERAAWLAVCDGICQEYVRVMSCWS